MRKAIETLIDKLSTLYRFRLIHTDIDFESNIREHEMALSLILNFSQSGSTNVLNSERNNSIGEALSPFTNTEA